MLKFCQLSKTFILLFCSMFMNMVYADVDNWQMNMFKGVTPLSRDMYQLHMIAMQICAIIGFVVFGVMIYSLIHHRKSKGYQAAKFHDNTRLEVVWTIIPFLILLGLAFPATRTLVKLENTERATVTIKVVGSQWKWDYTYLDQGLHFYSNLETSPDEIANKTAKSANYLLSVDNELVVPVHKKIRFLVTATDVIHSWWVPELGVKRDAIPGFMHEAWAKIQKPGIYRGQCTELCGVGHGYMPIVVRAVSDEEFKAWVSQKLQAQKKWQAQQVDLNHQPNMSRDELLQMGKKQYRRYCAACHQNNGLGIPPMYPALKGSSIAVGHPIARHTDLILYGSPGSAMQAYDQMLSNEDIASIVTYERNAWENNTNDMIQPIDVAKERISAYTNPIMIKKPKVGGLQ